MGSGYPPPSPAPLEVGVRRHSNSPQMSIIAVQTAFWGGEGEGEACTLWLDLQLLALERDSVGAGPLHRQHLQYSTHSQRQLFILTALFPLKNREIIWDKFNYILMLCQDFIKAKTKDFFFLPERGLANKTTTIKQL